MPWSKIERVTELARLNGITVTEDEVCEVADRLDSLLCELAQLASLELSGIEPVTIFPEEADRDD